MSYSRQVSAMFGVLLALPAAAGDVAWGAYLSGECVTCQRAGDAAIPKVAGRPEEEIVAALTAYRAGDRLHQAMQVIAGRLTDDEIAALAAYFASQ